MKSRIFLCALLSGTMAFSQVEDSIQTDSTAIEFDFVEIIQRLPLTSERIGKNELNQKNLGQEYSKILSIDESYEFDWKYNLSRGAIPFKIKEENLKIKLSNIAITVAKKLNLKFGSVDIIETNDNELFVLEANSGVMMENIKNILEDGQEITKEIYSKAIIKMFEE